MWVFNAKQTFDRFARKFLKLRCIEISNRAPGGGDYKMHGLNTYHIPEVIGFLKQAHVYEFEHPL